MFRSPISLHIAWRNPHSLPPTELLIEQIAADEFGAVYSVRTSNEVKVFFLHRADRSRPACA
jgi:hypothetical protein